MKVAKGKQREWEREQLRHLKVGGGWVGREGKGCQTKWLHTCALTLQEIKFSKVDKGVLSLVNIILLATFKYKICKIQKLNKIYFRHKCIIRNILYVS